MKIDKELIQRRFSESFVAYNEHADVQRRICSRLVESIDNLCINGREEVKKALEIGAGTGFLTTQLMCRYPSAEWFINDLSPEAEHFIRPILDTHKNLITSHPSFIWGDAEVVPYPADLNLIASASTVQWFVDMPAFIRKATTSLAPEGILAISSFGPENFRETRPSGLDYLAQDEITALAESAGLKIIYAEQWLETLSFENPHAVLRYIKTLGLNALSTKSYTKRFDARQLTYNPMIIIAKKV